MPIYEYQCQKCGHHHEALQRLSDPMLRQCPECGRKALKRLVSAVRFRLSGSGWYETDFKSDKEAKRNLHDKGESETAKPETAPATDATSKTDGADAAKPAAKADAKPDGSPVESKGSGERGERVVVTKSSSTPKRSKAAVRAKAARRAPAPRKRKR